MSKIKRAIKYFFQRENSFTGQQNLMFKTYSIGAVEDCFNFQLEDCFQKSFPFFHSLLSEIQKV